MPTDYPHQMPRSRVTPGDKGYSAVFERLKSNNRTVRRPADAEMISEPSVSLDGCSVESAPRRVNCFGDTTCRSKLKMLGRSLGNIKNSPDVTMREIESNPLAVMSARLLSSKP